MKACWQIQFEFTIDRWAEYKWIVYTWINNRLVGWVQVTWIYWTVILYWTHLAGINLPMISSSNGTSYPYNNKVEGELIQDPLCESVSVIYLYKKS